MLVLSRKKGEKIDIGDNITIIVLDIRGGQVKLGIEAPKDVTVLRKEVIDKKTTHQTKNIGENHERSRIS